MRDSPCTDLPLMLRRRGPMADLRWVNSHKPLAAIMAKPVPDTAATSHASPPGVCGATIRASRLATPPAAGRWFAGLPSCTAS